MIGLLINAMVCTRLDLCWTVTKLSQYLSKPTVDYHTCVKHVLTYIKGTSDHSLSFHKSEEGLKLVGYCDGDWGSSEDRKSTTGYFFL